MKRAFNLNNFKLDSPMGTTAEGFPKYLFNLSTGELNERYFRISEETRRHIRNQANAGVPVYQSHRTYSSHPSGYTINAKMVGGVVQSELYIQPGLTDVGTDELIARLNAGTIRDGSIQFTGGEFISDSDGAVYEYVDDGWFYAFKSKTGKRLGKEYDGVLETATVHGMVNLMEFSIDGMGADPGAGIVKKLSAHYGNDLDMTELAVISEINGFNLPQFSQRLGYDESTKTFQKIATSVRESQTEGNVLRAETPQNSPFSASFPSTPPRRKEQMATPTPTPTPEPSDDVQVLQEQVQRLSTENEKLATEKAELQAQLDQSEPEAIADLNREITQLTASVAEKDAEIERLTTLSEVGDEALKLERENAKRSVLLEMDLDPSEDNSGNSEYVRRCRDIDNMTSLSAIQSIASTNFRAARNRKGAKLEIPEVSTQAPEVRFSGMNNL